MMPHGTAPVFETRYKGKVLIHTNWIAILVDQEKVRYRKTASALSRFVTVSEKPADASSRVISIFDALQNSTITPLYFQHPGGVEYNSDLVSVEMSNNERRTVVVTSSKIIHVIRDAFGHAELGFCELVVDGDDAQWNMSIVPFTVDGEISGFCVPSGEFHRTRRVSTNIRAIIN